MSVSPPVATADTKSRKTDNGLKPALWDAANTLRGSAVDRTDWKGYILPLRDHTLLQAICRTNRPYGQRKTHGVIVDYLGVSDDVAQAIQFDEAGITRVVSNIAELGELNHRPLHG